MDLREIEQMGVDWIEVVKVWDQWWFLVKVIINIQVP
jgi:hypothetical protein